jgi:hypothetical protein
VIENVETGGQAIAEIEMPGGCSKTTTVAERSADFGGKNFDPYHSDGHDRLRLKLKNYRFVRCSEPMR